MDTTHEISASAINRFGFYVSLTTGFVTLATFTIAFLTPPLSGPACPGNCFSYPYADIASRYPRDYYWMFPAILVSLLFVSLLVNIHILADTAKKVFSHLGTAFGLLSAAILITNYFLQVTIVQASLVHNEREGIALITQYNPHGLFIAMEEIGFLLMNLALFVLIPVFPHEGRLNKSIRYTFLVSFILGISALLYFAFKFGSHREYYFEIVIISVVWFELILSSFLLAALYKKRISKH